MLVIAVIETKLKDVGTGREEVRIYVDTDDLLDALEEMTLAQKERLVKFLMSTPLRDMI